MEVTPAYLQNNAANVTYPPPYRRLGLIFFFCSRSGTSIVAGVAGSETSYKGSNVFFFVLHCGFLHLHEGRVKSLSPLEPAMPIA